MVFRTALLFINFFGLDFLFCYLLAAFILHIEFMRSDCKIARYPRSLIRCFLDSILILYIASKTIRLLECFSQSMFVFRSFCSFQTAIYVIILLRPLACELDIFLIGVIYMIFLLADNILS